MSLWTCLDCTARYAVGLPECPQCQSTDYTDDPDGIDLEPVPAVPAAKPPAAALPEPGAD